MCSGLIGYDIAAPLPFLLDCFEHFCGYNCRNEVRYHIPIFIKVYDTFSFGCVGGFCFHGNDIPHVLFVSENVLYRHFAPYLFPARGRYALVLQ